MKVKKMNQTISTQTQRNIPTSSFASRPDFANGRQIKLALDARLARERDAKLKGDDLELDGDELDDDDLELGAGMRKAKPRNIVEKIELARLKRALDRGEKLSPSEADRLGDMKSPVAEGLLKRNKELSKPKGFTLSTMKALLRGL